MSNVDREDVAPRAHSGGTASGDAPGLYGGTRRAASCDPAKIVSFLRANPAKAKAWAGVHKIAADEIPRFVSKLTPVLLRTDTLVVNHGYKKGKPTRGAAVLQRGIGVLINEYGVPVVKCNCGNPLTAPEKKISTGKGKYKGSSWPGFSKKKVTKVEKRSTVVAFVLVDPEAEIGFNRPLSTTGESDGPPTSPPPDAVSPGPSGSTSADPSTGPSEGPGGTMEPTPTPTTEPTVEPTGVAPEPTPEPDISMAPVEGPSETPPIS
ncbi:DUF6777 domain-containing protein [Spirillospora sp. CA-294931]|uniref:DUF6777 domain-containing protein n=1 Tax=Spirillospora sp. CA-294931 TaxID=3240042 RepID=UPI003D8D57AC